MGNRERNGGSVRAATDLGNGVYAVDTRMSGYEGITAGYVILADRPCLVETGTARSAPLVREALGSLGLGPTDLAAVVVTHIHLDHAGGVGELARHYPNAEIVVHDRGARHLVDPSRLVAGARHAYGPVFDQLFGEPLPIDAARVRAVEDTGTVDLGGGHRLESYHAPGHAKHHVGLLDSLTGDLYVGDAAGVYIPDTADLRPAAPPPDFDLDAALASLERFSALRPTRLLFTHFGPVDTVEETLARSAEELRLWVELVREARSKDLDVDHTVALVKERTQERYAALRERPEVERRFEVLNSPSLNIDGIGRWLDSHEGSS